MAALMRGGLFLISKVPMYFTPVVRAALYKGIWDCGLDFGSGVRV